MIPLTKQPLCFDTCINERVHCWNCHVWVNVPIMHALNQIDRALIIREHSIEEISFCPVISEYLRTKQVCRRSCSRSNQIIRTNILVILLVTINAIRPINTVMHNRGSSFSAAISPHEFLDTDEPGNWDDCFQIIVFISKHCRLPWC